MPMPALLIRASMAPKRARAGGGVTARSRGGISNDRMQAVADADVLRREACQRARIAVDCDDRWPAARSASVMTRPMPPEAPVKSATRELREDGISHLPYLVF